MDFGLIIWFELKNKIKFVGKKSTWQPRQVTGQIDNKALNYVQFTNNLVLF